MITKRLLILEAILLLGFSAVFLLPSIPKKQPVGVVMDLPVLVGQWFGKDAEVTEKEQQVLGPDTEFARKTYTDREGDQIFVSIVLAGQDMNTSIHRPERCLPAQGWTIADSRVVSIPLGDHETLRATRLHNAHPVRLANGREGTLYNLNYYWFVGYNDLTASHMKRTFYDIRDRLLKGYNQRWAYITIASNLLPRADGTMRTEAETDEMIREFIRQITPKIHKPSVNLG